jgi:hypothetical protein
MLANHLSSVSVGKTVSESGDAQQLEQKVQLTSSPVARVHSSSILKQGTTGDTAVTTESISSATADFVRYIDIKTSQKSQNGGAFDFSSVLGLWGKSGEDGSAQLFNQTALGVVPSANLAASQRKELMNIIKETGAYKINPKNVKRTNVAGRPTYSYQVSVSPVGYVTVLKAFARDIGLKQLEAIEPSDYAGGQPLSFTFDVDVWSGQLLKIAYEDSPRSETYGGYGSRTLVALPNDAVEVGELQTRLQQIR